LKFERKLKYGTEGGKMGKTIKGVLSCIIVLLLVACILAAIYGAFLTGITIWFFGWKPFSVLIFIGIFVVVFLIKDFFVVLWKMVTGED